LALFEEGVFSTVPLEFVTLNSFVGKMRKNLKFCMCLIKHHATNKYGGVEVYLHALISELDGDERSVSSSRSFTSGERTLCIQWTVSWVGPRVRLDVMKKKIISAPPGTRTLPPPVHRM
jgi:hypothetical protein